MYFKGDFTRYYISFAIKLEKENNEKWKNAGARNTLGREEPSQIEKIADYGTIKAIMSL